MKHRNLLEAWYRKLVTEMGTPASGHWGHASVKGRHGGSARGGQGHLLSATKAVDGVRVMADGSPLPAHIQKLPIPPAWKSVRVNPDPKAKHLVVGKDSKGRPVGIMNEVFKKTNAIQKYSRVRALERAYDSIVKENEANRKSADPVIREAADCLHVIMKTGIRPGSTADTKADVQAYGATTLEGRHVKVSGGEVTLNFVGKKGVSLSIPIADRATATMLRKRALASGTRGKLFDTDQGTLLRYSKSLNGGAGFKTKDFRTRLANEVAAAEMRKINAPADKKSYIKSVKAVAKAVAAKLGNTATVCLQSYINPLVFQKWSVTE